MPYIKRSYYGFFCTMLFLVLMTLKLWLHIPVLTFAIVGVGVLGLADTLYVRYRLKEESNLDYVTFVVGGLIVIWFLAEVLFPS